MADNQIDPASHGAAASPPPFAEEEHRCQWCSAELTDPGADHCPVCDACLAGDPDAFVPGVTAVDPEAVRKVVSWQRPPKRGLLGFLMDQAGPEESGIRPSSVEALDPPSEEVRLEILRLRAELDAAAALEQEQPAS